MQSLATLPIEPTTKLVSENRRVTELDGVRGMAITMVVAFHYLRFSFPSHSIPYYAVIPLQQLWSGVDLFFVLSGLLIGGILLDHKESNGYFSVFYKRRVSRIFPLYYVMVALLFAGRHFFPGGELFAGGIPLWAFPLFIQNVLGIPFTSAPPWIGSTWSLAVEEQFYLLLPFVIRFLPRKALIQLLGVVIIGAPLLRLGMVMRGLPFEQFYALLPCRADALALGVVAALIIRNESAMSWVRKRAPHLYAAMFVMLAVLQLIQKWRAYLYLNALSFTLFDAMYFLLILLVLVAPTPSIKSVFNAKALRSIGVISYCVYLIHTPVRDLVFAAMGISKGEVINEWKPMFATLISLGVVLLIASASWRALEHPLIKRAHRRYQYD